MNRILTLASLLCAFQVSVAQQNKDALDYIARYKDLAIKEMLRCHIPASITLAQGIHESACGKSQLCVQTNNHFGIKCTNVWEGKTYYQNDDAPNECFRVYDRPEDSYADHSDFIGTRPRYSFLFQLPITDYKSWAYGLKTAGYATNPKYPEILLKTIELYNLQQYDAIGLAMMGGNVSPQAPVSSILAPEAKVEPDKPSNKHPQKVKENKESNVPVEVIASATAARPEFTVNGIRALKAQGNEDPLSIAFDNNIDYDRVVAYNDLAEGEYFKDGEYIYLQAKKSRGTSATYAIKQGESMHDISQKFGIKLKELYAKNQMKPNDQVYPGETVYLQEKRSSAPHTMTYVEFLKSLSSPRASASTVSRAKAVDQADASIDKAVPVIVQNNGIAQPSSYKVERSDTLYSIARKFNVSVQQLRALNNLQGSDLYPGQTLVVRK